MSELSDLCRHSLRVASVFCFFFLSALRQCIFGGTKHEMGYDFSSLVCCYIQLGFSPPPPGSVLVASQLSFGLYNLH